MVTPRAIRSVQLTPEVVLTGLGLLVLEWQFFGPIRAAYAHELGIRYSQFAVVLATSAVFVGITKLTLKANLWKFSDTILISASVIGVISGINMI